MNVPNQIKQLSSLVSDELNEKILAESGERLLQELRKAWKTQRAEFTNEDVATLKKLADQISAVKNFIEEQDEFRYISTIEESDEIIDRLYSIIEILKDLKIAGRIRKEIREMIERQSNLPPQAESVRSAAIKGAVTRLLSNSPQCPKCGGQMQLRGKNEDFFWGCSKFPNCWGKKQLSKTELALLPD